MIEKNKKLVIFDFDGVLINTLDFCYEIYKEENNTFTYEQFQNFSNGNFCDGVGKALENGFKIPIDFHSKYLEKIMTFNIEDILHDSVLSLSDRYLICIVSSSQGNLIKEFIAKENLQGCFSEVLGSDVHKSKVFKIKYILDKYKIQNTNAVLVTDTLGDILEANECKIYSIGVTWGLHDKETLLKGHPKFIVEDPVILVDQIDNVFN